MSDMAGGSAVQERRSALGACCWLARGAESQRGPEAEGRRRGQRHAALSMGGWGDAYRAAGTRGLEPNGTCVARRAPQGPGRRGARWMVPPAVRDGCDPCPLPTSKWRGKMQLHSPTAAGAPEGAPLVGRCHFCHGPPRAAGSQPPLWLCSSVSPVQVIETVKPCKL